MKRLKEICNFELAEKVAGSYGLHGLVTCGCEEKKQYEVLGKGSSRRVYAISEKAVLKLAINAKGFDQNMQEVTIWNDPYTALSGVQKILARVMRYAEDFSWLEMERVQPATAEDFEKHLHVPYKEFFALINTYAGKRGKFNEAFPDIDEKVKMLFDMADLFEYSYGDFKYKDCWGITEDGRMVVCDYGLSRQIWRTHYKKEKKNEVKKTA